MMNMERKSPTDPRSGNEADLNKEDQEGLKLAQRARNALDPFSIPVDQLAKDPYLGKEPVEDYLQRQREE
jgi:hypothetical protein